MLALKGRVEIKVSSPTVTSPALHSFPIGVDLKVGLTLRPQEGALPAIGLIYGGFENLNAPLSDAELELAISESGLLSIISELKMDVLTPIVEGMETVLFYGKDEDEFPPRESYKINIRAMKGYGDHVDALGLFISLPDDSITPSNIPSFVPSYSDVSLTLSETMINAMVENAKQELQDFIKGLLNTIKINKLTASSDNNRINLYAKITETYTDSVVEIDTDVFLHLVPGSTRIGLKAHIEMDYDFPWYIDLVKAFMIGEDEFLEEDIPNMAQKYVEDIANNMLGKVSESIKLDGLALGGIPVEVYPQKLSLENGKIDLHVMVLTYKTEDFLRDASYSSLRDRFIFFTLQSGRRLKTADLARFMKMGLLSVPGYHDVDGQYVRANPDDTEANNLLTRFGRN